MTLFRKILIILLVSFVAASPLLTAKSKLYAASGKQIEFAADTPPYLEDIVMRSDEGKITLSLRVANPFDHEQKSLLLNGVSQKIGLEVTVNVNRFNLYLVKFNREIKNTSYIHTIHYDNLKKIFSVTLAPTTAPHQLTSYKEAVKLASVFNDIHLLSANEIEPGRTYQVGTQAEIRKVRLPFHLEYLFFFLSAWDRKSNRYTIDIPERLIRETIQR